MQKRRNSNELEKQLRIFELNHLNVCSDTDKKRVV